MLVNLIRRAQHLIKGGEDLTASDSLLFFLNNQVSLEDFKSRKALDSFGCLDDHDVWGAIKFWRNHNDTILSTLSRMLTERKLFSISLGNEPVKKSVLEKIRTRVVKEFKILRSESSYLFSHGTVSNEAYTEGQSINILMKDGQLVDIVQASDLPNIKALGKIVKKNYLCWPKNVSL